MDPVGDGLVGSGLWWRSELLAIGMTDEELRRLRRSGAADRVRRGAYVVADPAEQEALEDVIVRHRLAVQAAVPRLGPGTVISHLSAVVLHGLPVWLGPDQRFESGRVQATRDRRSGARRSAYVARRRGLRREAPRGCAPRGRPRGRQVDLVGPVDLRPGRRPPPRRPPPAPRAPRPVLADFAWSSQGR